jgi:hypothetical protein
MKKLVDTTATLVGIFVLVPVLAGATGSDSDLIQQERMEIGRALIEVQSTNWPSVLPYYTQDMQYHDPIVDIYGIDMMSEFLGRLFANSPDLVTTVEDETLINGVYTATWTMVGQFSGVPYSAKGISIIKFRGSINKVYYQRGYYSENDIMLNIPGLAGAAVGFRTFYRCAVDPTFSCPFANAATDAAPGSEMGMESREPENHGTPDLSLVGLRRERLEVGRALIEINATNWPSLLQYYTYDIEYHDPIVDIYGKGTMAEFLGRLFSNAPDLVTTVEDESLVNGIYTATWTMAGRFTGFAFSAKGMSIVKFRRWSTQVYYARDYYTEGDIMANIPGLDEAVEGFRTFYRCAVDPTFGCPLGEPLTLGGIEALETEAKTPPYAASFRLRQNVPNPFKPATTISFEVPNGGANVSLRIYDVAGRLIRTLVDGYEPSGIRAVSWNGKNDTGRSVPGGVYFYQLTAPSFSKTKKMLLLE